MPAARRGDNVAVITIEGMISGITSKSVERRIKRAIEGGADVIVIELDTPGGEVGAALEICQAIKSAPVYTTAWVNPDAYSAGAIIALACDEIVLAPNATMGDAAPVRIGVNPSNLSFGLQNLSETERSKTLIPLITEVTDSARRNGYDENAVLGFLSLGIELWIVENTRTGERYFVDEDEYRALFGEDPPEETSPVLASGVSGEAEIERPTPTELREDYAGAMEKLGDQDGSTGDTDPFDLGTSADGSVENPFLVQALPTERPNFADQNVSEWRYVRYASDGRALFTMKERELQEFGFADPNVIIANDTELKTHHGAKELRRLDQSWSESFAAFMNYTGWGFGIRALLVAVFLLALLIELILPGTGGGAVVATIALAGLILPSLMAGAHTWWALAFILAGVALLAVEIFVLPGFGVAAAIGGLCLIVGLIGSFAGTGQLFPGVGGVSGGGELTHAVAIVLVGFFAAGVGAWVLSRYYTTLPIASHLVLTESQKSYTGTRDEPGMLEAMGPPSTDAAARPGEVGTAITDLHPGGTAEFDNGRLVDVVYEDGYLEKGTRVRVTEATAYRVAVVHDNQQDQSVAHSSGPSPSGESSS